jgi:hypothetical protein
MRLLPLALLCLAGCTQLPPDLDMAETPAARVAPFPALVPVEPVLAAAGEGRLTGAEAGAIEARAARLRARAAALRRVAAAGG